MSAAEMAAIAEAEAEKAVQMNKAGGAPKSVALGALSGPTFHGEVISKEDEDKQRAQAALDWEEMQAALAKTKREQGDGKEPK